MDLFSRADELFAFFDKNNDGYISRGEFISVVETLVGEKGKGVSAPLFLEADRNLDGRISHVEFMELLRTIEFGS